MEADPVSAEESLEDGSEGGSEEGGADDQGSAENPYPIGHDAVISHDVIGDWVIRLNSVDPDVTDQVMDYNMFNSEPEGTVIMGHWSVTYIDGELDPSFPQEALNYAFVTHDGEVHKRGSVAVVPDQLHVGRNQKIAMGDTVSGNVAVDTPDTDGLWRVSVGVYEEDEVFFTHE